MFYWVYVHLDRKAKLTTHGVSLLRHWQCRQGETRLEILSFTVVWFRLRLRLRLKLGVMVGSFGWPVVLDCVRGHGGCWGDVGLSQGSLGGDGGCSMDSMEIRM